MTTTVERYQLAVTEFRSAWAALAVADLQAGRQGFGVPIDVVQLRHSLANPGESGSLADDIKKVLA
jgi:hypothetical protein